jgi:hypothetical protein
MAQPARAFHAIDGLELHQLATKLLEDVLEEATLGFKDKAALLDSASRQLGLDTRFEPHLTYPRGSYNVQITLNLKQQTWQVDVTVRCDLHEPAVWTSTSRGRLGETKPQAREPVPPPVRATTSGVTIDETPAPALDEAHPTLAGDDMRDRRIQTTTQHGEPIDTDTKPFSLDQLPEAERLAILAERETIQKRNDRVIAEAQANGSIVLTGEGDLDRPNAARMSAGLDVPTRQRGDDGRSYDVSGKAPVVEETI